MTGLDFICVVIGLLLMFTLVAGYICAVFYVIYNWDTVSEKFKNIIDKYVRS